MKKMFYLLLLVTHVSNGAETGFFKNKKVNPIDTLFYCIKQQLTKQNSLSIDEEKILVKSWILEAQRNLQGEPSRSIPEITKFCLDNQAINQVKDIAPKVVKIIGGDEFEERTANGSEYLVSSATVKECEVKRNDIADEVISQILNPKVILQSCKGLSMGFMAGIIFIAGEVQTNFWICQITDGRKGFYYGNEFSYIGLGGIGAIYAGYTNKSQDQLRTPIITRSRGGSYRLKDTEGFAVPFVVAVKDVKGETQFRGLGAGLAGHTSETVNKTTGFIRKLIRTAKDSWGFMEIKLKNSCAREW